jgi:demethylmenaquinone methyltransferase/2-methoxy-6-polyprenyl-1,4-benzoquinol methylase
MLSYVPADPRVEAVRGFAENMPFANATFDAAVVSDAFHHLRNADAATREIARVVRPGGGVLVLDLDRDAPWMWVAIWGERLLGEPAAFLTPDEMRAFMALRGIDGTCQRQKGPSYSFLGVVSG